MAYIVRTASRWGAIEYETRSPEEIFVHHVESLRAEDMEGILLDYADDACVITNAGLVRGKEAIARFYARVLLLLPRAEWEVHPTFADDVALVEWTADSARNSVADGVDTLVFVDGLIHVHTVRCTIDPKG